MTKDNETHFKSLARVLLLLFFLVIVVVFLPDYWKFLYNVWEDTEPIPHYYGCGTTWGEFRYATSKCGCSSWEIPSYNSNCDDCCDEALSNYHYHTPSYFDSLSTHQWMLLALLLLGIILALFVI